MCLIPGMILNIGTSRWTRVLLLYRVAVTTRTLPRLRLVKQLLHFSFTAGIVFPSSYVCFMHQT